MKISRIEAQKRNRKRSNIYLNGEYRFALDNEIILNYDLKEGDEITEEQISYLLLAEQKRRLKQRAYRLLRYRNRSIAEMKERLQRLGYETEMVEEIVRELIEEGILNDQKFVRDFVSDYTYLKPKGNVFIINELRKRKIDGNLIQEILQERDEKPLIKDIIKKRFGELDKGNKKQKAKIVRYLLSKGFTHSSIYEVLGEDYE
ncbi:MAG: RecX family transcriptional regulator [candidate division WOR-3 bacterium]|nr:RecX family transcriptional regulator [candidate division WOR-3 bacterium]